MQRGIVFISCFLVSIVNSNCGGTKTKFSSDELKWLNVYKEGDTLIFKSDKGKIDTTLIIKKEIFYPEYNPVEVHDKYLPQWGIVWYQNKNLSDHPEGAQLISMFKKHPRNSTNLHISYLYSHITVLNLTTDGVKKYKNGKIYEFDTYHPKAPGSQPKKIFWHEDYGIIKFITHADVVWERINTPNL
jgi:hypothetical protein